MTAINKENMKIDINLPNKRHYKISQGAYVTYVPPYPDTIAHLSTNKQLNRIYKQKRPLVVKVEFDERSDTNFGETYYIPVHCSFCGTYANYWTRYDVYPRRSEVRNCSSKTCKKLSSGLNRYGRYA